MFYTFWILLLSAKILSNCIATQLEAVANKRQPQSTNFTGVDQVKFDTANCSDLAV